MLKGLVFVIFVIDRWVSVPDLTPAKFAKLGAFLKVLQKKHPNWVFLAAI